MAWKKGVPFWDRVLRGAESACWPWTGGRCHFGHGKWAEPVTRRTIHAHREAWRRTRGEIPAGLCVLHHCDNPPCCNPSHLFLGTQIDNMADRDAKGRQARGEAFVGITKLSEAKVLELYRLKGQGFSNMRIGSLLGVSGVMVGKILRGKWWKHVPRPEMGA